MRIGEVSPADRCRKQITVAWEKPSSPESAWAHDPFFDYVDRWMHENDAAFVQTIQEATGKDHDKPWARQGQAWDAFVNEMWAKHRPSLDAPTDGWKKKHDDRRYRAAIETSQ